MNEAFKKISRMLNEQKQPSRIEFLLPKKVLAEEPSEDSGVEGKTMSSQHTNPAAAVKIGVGGRDFRLDELSSEALKGGAGSETAVKIGTGGRMIKLDELDEDAKNVSDPLLGNIFTPANSREISLEDLAPGSDKKMDIPKEKPLP